MEDDDDVRTQFAVINNDDGPASGGKTEGVKRKWHEENFQAWQTPDLRNECVALREKFVLPCHKTIVLSCPLVVFGVPPIRQGGRSHYLEFLADRSEFVG